jgi:hypothetical protein
MKNCAKLEIKIVQQAMSQMYPMRCLLDANLLAVLLKLNTLAFKKYRYLLKGIQVIHVRLVRFDPNGKRGLQIFHNPKRC